VIEGFEQTYQTELMALNTSLSS